MTSKVNTKFILGLGAALSLAFVAVVYVAYQSVKKSGDDYIKLGDKAVAEAKYTEAIGLYGKAVFKDQRNADWIRKWLSAMEKETPKGRALYLDGYRKYQQAIQVLAEADRRDFDANKRALNERWETIRLQPSLGALEDFVKTVEDSAKAFQGDPEKGKLLWRYRGLAKVAMLQYNPDLKKEDLDTARKDLDAALAVDPSDKDTMLALVNLDLTDAEKARKNDDKPTVKQITEAIDARIGRFIADFPPASAARAAQIKIELQSVARGSERPVTAQDVLQDPTRQPRVEALIAAVLAEKPEKVEPETVLEAARYARISLPHPRSIDAPTEVFDHAMRARPDNGLLMLLASSFATDKGDTDGGLALLQKIVDMPDRPMSLEGLTLFELRVRAVKQQTDVAFRAWETEKDQAKKDAAAAQAKKFRDEFVARVGETNNAVLAIDARLAYITGDLKGATTLLTRYNQQSKEQDADSMALLGTLMLQQGNAGAAKQSFDRVLQLDERNLRALTALSRIATDNGEYSEALRYATAALSLQPENAGLKEQVNVLRDLAGGDVKEPVLQVILKARQQMTGVDADNNKALKTLRDGLAEGKNADDFRIHVALIQLLARMNDKPGAIEAIDAAMVKFPAGDMHTNLGRFKDSLQTTDPVGDAIKRIDTAAAPQVSKLVAKYEIYVQQHEMSVKAGKPDDARVQLEAAKVHLDEAVKLAPNDPQVADGQFDYALRTKNKEELRRLAEFAREKNLDQADGQLYLARVLVVEEKFAEAAQALRNVVERDRLNFSAWRLLGITNMRLQNAEAAADAFGKAMAIRPSDIATITGYVRSLAGSNRVPEALEAARKAEKIAATDPEFAELYLSLLANAPGGDPTKARELRERLALVKPDNKSNKVDLALLQLDQRRWDEAKATIDSLRADETLKDEVTALDARWFALQGKYAEAEKVFDDAIAAMPADKRTEMVYIAAADTLARVGQNDRASAFLEKGRAVQKPESMLIDRQLGDVLFGARKMPEAIAAYKRVLDAGSKDENDAVAKRILEASLIQKDYAKFDEMLAALGERAKADATLLVLQAESAAAQGDTARAAKLYDQAVVADQKSYIVFMKRGNFSAQDPNKVRDAIADFEQAARLAPNFTQPHRKLFHLYAETDKPEKAIEHLTKAVAIDPEDDTLRSDLIRIHLNNRAEAEVVDLVDQAIKLKPDNIEWKLQGASLMSGMNRFDRGADYGRDAWAKEKTLRVAIPYITALLNKTPQPDINTARTVVLDKELDKADEMPRRILRALFYNKTNDAKRTDEEMALAIAKLDQSSPGQVDLFTAGAESVFGEPREQMVAINRFKGKTVISGWLEVQIEVYKLRDQTTAAAAAPRLAAIADASKEPQLKAFVYQLLAQFNFQTNQPEQAVSFYDKLLAINPEEVGALNNSAYIMATKLNQPADALPRAEKAVGISPDSATVLDTLGAVHLKLKNNQKAADVLEKAVAKSTSDGEQIPALIHLATAYMGLNRKDEAQKLLDKVGERFKAVPALEQQFGPDLKEVAALLDGH